MTMQTRDILARMADLKAAGEPFALATVVRTVALTAAKAGAKAVIRADGTITDGWIGGGCARGGAAGGKGCAGRWAATADISIARRCAGRTGRGTG